jgi:hypothetical protein
MLPLAASDITLSVGDIDVTGLVPGDKVYISVTIDAITPGEEISGWQFFIWHDQMHITWDGTTANPGLGINYLSPFFPNCPCGIMYNVNPNSELVFLFGDGSAFLNLSNQTLPFLIIEFTFTYHGGIGPGESSPLIWGTSGKNSFGTTGKGTTEVYTWDEFDYFTLHLNNGSINNTSGLFQTTWTGAINADWFNAGNWTNGIPGLGINAVIPYIAGSCFPVIADGEAITSELNISPFATLVIESQAALTTNSLFVNDGLLLIKSDSISGFSGSYLNKAGMEGTGLFEFDRYVICSGTTQGSTDPFGWHYLSAPVDGFTTDDLYDYYINAWNRGSGTWIHYDPEVPCTQWTTTALTPLKAWSINFALDYSGNSCPDSPEGTGRQIEFISSVEDVHHGNYARPITNGLSGYSMWNMVSNPYPSGLDLNTLTWDANLIQAAALYDGCVGNYIYWAAGLGSFIVPPTQGFFIEGIGYSYSHFSVRNENRAHATLPFYKNEVSNLLTLCASGDGKTDVLHIRFADDVTTGFDLNGDAHKFFAETDGLPQIYTLAGDEKLAINALPETATVPMGFTANRSGNYTIEAIETSGFETVILEDLFSGVQTDLLMESYSFHFNSGDDPDRFLIHFEPGISVQRANDISIWSSGHTVFVKGIEGSGDIGVFNLLGQPILKKQSEPKKVNQIELNDLHGCFIVKVSTGSFTNTEKVIIR